METSSQDQEKTRSAGHPEATRPRLIAFYLPQFHEIPENNAWWGDGFTEWTNVRKAKPLFPGHNQPRRPGALGYYDLNDPHVRTRQAQLAKAHNIEGFCYWHYWFGNGRRILEMPFNTVLDSGEPDFPFCLCWANQSWTGVWHGAPKRMLMEQTYPGPADDQAHFDTILPAFKDRRYMSVGGRPIFVIYGPFDLPDPQGFVERWQRMASSAGFDGLYLIAMANDISHPSLKYFDRIMPFGPGDFLEQQPKLSFLKRLARRTAGTSAAAIFGGEIRTRMNAPLRYDFKDFVYQAFAYTPDDDRYVPCVMSGWDNTPRSGRRGIVVTGADADLFSLYMRKALKRVANRHPSERLVFLKSWNEWAEGNMLEPASDTDFSYLDVIKDVTEDMNG